VSDDDEIERLEDLPADERAAYNARLNELKSFQRLMGSKVGRAIMWRMLGECGVFVNALGITPEATAWNVGRQSVGQWLLAEINAACPQRYAQMQRENVKQEKAK
jgi:hypothetical protein